LASIATLRKILNRFVAHRVFYEVSSRNKRGHEFFSAKNTFVVGSIEIVNRDYLTITIFDANNPAHSIEILNPAAMRIYDDTLGKGFAVSFLSEGSGGVESRCYLRDEGDEGDGIQERGALEKITLPQLFERTAQRYPDRVATIFHGARLTYGELGRRIDAFAAGLRAELIHHIFSPVQWVRAVETMRDAGITDYLEIGPGNILSGLIKRTQKDAQTQTSDALLATEH